MTKKVVINGLEVNEEQFWTCTIGPIPAAIIHGGKNDLDFPMRQAVAEMFYDLFAVDCEVLFSGWNAELTEGERQALDENRRRKTV